MVLGEAARSPARWSVKNFASQRPARSGGGEGRVVCDPSSQVGDGEAMAQRVRVGAAGEVGDAGIGQVAAEPGVYGRLVDRPARSPAVEHVIAVLGAGCAAAV